MRKTLSLFALSLADRVDRFERAFARGNRERVAGLAYAQIRHFIKGRPSASLSEATAVASMTSGLGSSPNTCRSTFPGNPNMIVQNMPGAAGSRRRITFTTD